MSVLYPKNPTAPGIVVRLDLTRKEARSLRLTARRLGFYGQSDQALLRAYLKWILEERRDLEEDLANDEID